MTVPTPETRTALISDLIFALSRLPRATLRELAQPRRPGERDIELRITATKLVEHIELSGWRLDRKPPSRGHSTP